MTNQIPTVIIDTQEQSIELLTLYLKELDFIHVSDTFDNIVTGYNAIMETRPSLVIIDISSKTELAFEIINKLTANHKTCKIIVFKQ